jgi:hypothetical protein
MCVNKKLMLYVYCTCVLRLHVMTNTKVNWQRERLNIIWPLTFNLEGGGGRILLKTCNCITVHLHTVLMRTQVNTYRTLILHMTVSWFDLCYFLSFGIWTSLFRVALELLVLSHFTSKFIYLYFLRDLSKGFDIPTYLVNVGKKAKANCGHH